jgi:hypothetical protein
MERLLAAVWLKRLAEGPEVDQTSLEKLVGLVQEQRQAVPVVVDTHLLQKYSVVPAHLRAILRVLDPAALGHLLAFSLFPDLTLFITFASLDLALFIRYSKCLVD